ncbi:MAG: fatty acid hydroxylase [Rhodobacteraceae bacterium]|nr:fatty acid hydroxylase [Paracoccaceae bacterium]
MNRAKMILGHTSIPPMLVAVAVGLVILVTQGPWWIWLFAVLGIPTQMLNEYSLHRYIFHLPPPKRQWAFDLLYQAHYGHHDFPTKIKLFFAPIWVTLPILALNIGIVWALAALVLPAHALAIAAAIVLVGGTGTFLGYEWFHMTAHLTVPKTWVERHVTTLHNQHHFRDFSKWFHVSPGGQIIDRAMGTSINHDALRQQQRIEFIRTLGMRPDDARLVAARARFAEKYDLTPTEITRAAQVQGTARA